MTQESSEEKAEALKSEAIGTEEKVRIRLLHILQK